MVLPVFLFIFDTNKLTYRTTFWIKLSKEYLEEVEDLQKDIEKLLRDIERTNNNVEKFRKGANYDNVLRIDQVIFEPIAL